MSAQESYWMGKPLNQLSREELIEALKTMGRLYRDALRDHIKDLEKLKR